MHVQKGIPLKTGQKKGKFRSKFHKKITQKSPRITLDFLGLIY